MFSGIITYCKLIQPLKDDLGIIFSSVGIKTSFNAHPIKHATLNSSMLSGRFNDSSFEQPQKALSPIFLIPLGKTTFSRLLHFKNEKFFISTRLFGNVISLMVEFLKIAIEVIVEGNDIFLQIRSSSSFLPTNFPKRTESTTYYFPSV